MKLWINGEEIITEITSLLEFLEWRNQTSDENNTYAIAVNEQFVPRAHYASTQLNEGDRIEILSPMQGG